MPQLPGIRATMVISCLSLNGIKHLTSTALIHSLLGISTITITLGITTGAREVITATEVEALTTKDLNSISTLMKFQKKMPKTLLIWQSTGQSLLLSSGLLQYSWLLLLAVCAASTEPRPTKKLERATFSQSTLELASKSVVALLLLQLTETVSNLLLKLKRMSQ